MTTRTQTATAGLEERRAALDTARQRFEELERERSAVARRVDRARAPWVEYVRAVELGERDADAAEEERLKIAWQEIAASLSREDVIVGDRGVIETEWVDPAIEARLSAASEIRQRRENELHSFIAANRAELAAEHLPSAEAAGACAAPACDGVFAAKAKWDASVRYWHYTLGYPLEEIPPFPAAIEVDPQALGDIPVPRSLRRGNAEGPERRVPEAPAAPSSREEG